MNKRIESVVNYVERQGKENPFVFISGAISNRLDTYKDIFNEVERAFNERGYQCYNPAKQINTNTTWLKAMLETLKALQDVDIIYVLKDWENSTGTLIEIVGAYMLDIPVAFEEEPSQKDYSKVGKMLDRCKEESKGMELGRFLECLAVTFYVASEYKQTKKNTSYEPIPKIKCNLLSL